MRTMRWLLAAVMCSALAGCACGVPPPPPPAKADGGVPTGDGGPGQVPCTGSSYARCEAECVNLDADSRHCGACGNACPSGGTCFVGTCACPSGTVLCGDACVDPNTNSDHCGKCNNACAPGTACTGATCQPQCQSGLWKCGEQCADFTSDESHCGQCNNACSGGMQCLGGACKCGQDETSCGGNCKNLQTDETACGACGTQCFTGFECVAGKCECPTGKTSCTTACVDTSSDPNNCGGCNLYCSPGQACVNGQCDTPCPVGWNKCNGQCVDPQTSAQHCGACGNFCGNLSCIGGACVTCNSATTDCDGDGWKVSDGDCCDTPGPGCGSVTALINPGALELKSNGLDDNCNGLVDTADALDLAACDSGLASSSALGEDYARAMGICRTTTETAPLNQKTWGLISAQLLRADGSAVTSPVGHSIRQSFGSVLKPFEGRSMVLIASGAAADSTQTNPGPNGGPAGTSLDHNWSTVDIQSCTQPYCIKDWFGAGNPPLKNGNMLPEAPGCAGSLFGGNTANDSVMLVLRLRAPTNARAFTFKGYFLSSEYPEYVCTTFNDQLVALVDTPGGTPIGAVNPVDKNLMTYFSAGQRWPIGINVAKGTSIFKVCESQTANLSCWDSDVSTQSCGHGIGDLAGTGYEAWGALGTCTNGGGTGWLNTSGNVRPGEIVELRIAIWDVGDHSLDSLAILDDFRWLQGPAAPGTTD